jgi:hypothetical protein
MPFKVAHEPGSRHPECPLPDNTCRRRVVGPNDPALVESEFLAPRHQSGFDQPFATSHAILQVGIQRIGQTTILDRTQAEQGLIQLVNPSEQHRGTPDLEMLIEDTPEMVEGR